MRLEGESCVSGEHYPTLSEKRSCEAMLMRQQGINDSIACEMHLNCPKAASDSISDYECTRSEILLTGSRASQKGAMLIDHVKLKIHDFAGWHVKLECGDPGIFCFRHGTATAWHAEAWLNFRHRGTYLCFPSSSLFIFIFFLLPHTQFLSLFLLLD